MPVITEQKAGGVNVLAFLDMLAWSEIGPDMLADPESEDGYRLLVGSLPGKLKTFASYADRQAAPIWASLPGAGYGQREHRLSKLLDIYAEEQPSMVQTPEELLVDCFCRCGGVAA